MPEPLQPCPNCGATLRGRGRKAFGPRCVLRLGLSESQLRPQDTAPEQATACTHALARATVETARTDGCAPSDMVGRVLGEYEILTELGRGGMGVVYKTFDETLSRVVALKVLAPRLRDNPLLLRRFRREAQAAARLQHPNIVSIYGVGQEGDEHFFVMEFVRGVDLAEHLRTNGPMKTAEVVALARQVASALAAAHDAGIVHRDILDRLLAKTPADRFASAGFSPDVPPVACANFSAAWLLDTRTGEPAVPLTQHGYGLSVVCFSPDGKRVLTVSPYYRCLVQVWDLEGNGLAQLDCKGPRTARWSPDGTSIITSSDTAEGSLVRFWDSVPLPQEGEDKVTARASIRDHVDRRRRGPGIAPAR